jgi:hypothetical protein
MQNVVLGGIVMIPIAHSMHEVEIEEALADFGPEVRSCGNAILLIFFNNHITVLSHFSYYYFCYNATVWLYSNLITQ